MRPFESNLTFSGSSPGASAGCLNVTNSSIPICRICHEGDQTECLVSLCKCTGNMGLLHVSCLEDCLNTQNVDHCELCHHRFATMAQATGIRQFFYWALHAGSLWRALGDLICFAVMTPLTILTCFYCIQIASKQALEGRIMGLVSVVLLSGLFLTAYLCSFFYTVRLHYRDFVLWQTQNSMRETWVWRSVVPNDGQPRTPDGQQASSRKIVDVGAASVTETERAMQLIV